MKFKHKSTKGISLVTYRISFWSNIKELRYKVWKLADNYEEKMGITSLWPDLWPKVTRVWASAGSNHLAKTSSKSVHPFGWNFIHKKCRTHRHTQPTNCSENITPPRFRGGVKKTKTIPCLNKTRSSRSEQYSTLDPVFLHFMTKNKGK